MWPRRPIIALITAVSFILTDYFARGQYDEAEFPPEGLYLSPDQPIQNQPAGAIFAVFCNKGSGNGRYSDFKWISPQGLEITRNNTATIYAFESENGLALNFDSPTPENSGRYTCKALYGGTSSLQVPVKISFFHDITFDNCPTTQDLVLGRDGTVRCQVHGNPVPRVLWDNQRGIQLSSERFTIVGSSLNIRHVMATDAGRYRVTAMVEATGKIKREFITVNVITPPNIIELKNVTDIIEGSSGMAVCAATGIPPPLCYWTDFKGRNLSDVGGFRVTPQSCILEFIQTSREYEGVYTCHAVNAGGKAVRDTQVEVIIPSKIIEFQNKTVNEDGEVALECQAEGKPIPEVHIRKEQALISLGHSNDDGGGVISLKNLTTGYVTTLIATIFPVRQDHSGLYYCSAENRVNRVERTGKLDVNYAPLLTAKKNPVFTWGSRPAMLTCHIQAIPNATVQWKDLHGNLLNDKMLYSVDNSVGMSVLTVTDQAPRFSQDFVCVALNNLGERSLVFTIREARRPNAPSQPKVLRVTATTVTFEFNRLVDNGGMPILQYLTKYWREGQSLNEAKIEQFAEMIGEPRKITQLIPRTKYFFTFSARSEVGEGPHSEPLQIDTTVEAVPDPPIFISPPHADVHPSRVHIEWTMPLSNGKPIDHFLVSYQLVEQVSATEFRDTGRRRSEHVTSWASMVSKDLLDLRPEMFYRVRVEAHNELGYGEPAELVFRTGPAPGMIGPYPNNGDNGARNVTHIISTPVIIALAVLLTFILLILFDVLCYFQFRKGLLYALRHLVCSKPRHIYSKTNQNPLS
ncbi:fasciclin-2-like isoform X2 [Varroa jacobsoni]|nr:fasciclin-2-like isoform X2 [Varroa jacobsoni]XP_022705772.1 fasciclin-2-like isoform X2 [Varroa jacobsoni]